MLHTSALVPAATLVAALLGFACDSATPSPAAPTQSPAATTSTATPTPPALVGVWNVKVELTAVTADLVGPSGFSCVGETMRSRIGEPNPYSLSITDNGKVTIASASGDYRCSFTPVMDGSGFTTFGKGGTYSCAGEPQAFRCGDGTTYVLHSFGQDLEGRVSGSDITGMWEIFWYTQGLEDGVEVKLQFAGSR